MNPDSLAYIEQVLARYARDPGSVGQEWRAFLERNGTPEPDSRQSHRGAPSSGSDRAPSDLVQGGSFSPGNGRASQPGAEVASSADLARLQDKVDQLVRGYRVRGHLAAAIDALGRPRPGNPEIEIETWGLTAADLDREVSTHTIAGPNRCTVGETITRLRDTYCRTIGAQFMHIDDREVRAWLQDRMEGSCNRLELTRQQHHRILTRLTEAEVFEAFTRRKFVGAKTFSLEGAESLIPLLDLAFENAADDGVEEIVMGMAHRGRLNVLANILGKREKHIFLEIDDPGIDEEERVLDDVRYHLGHSSTWICSSGRQMHISLCFNPSHLEYVNPVALGRMRAKQLRFGDQGRNRGMVLLVHGDAAFAGEGIVQETLNLSQLPGYTTGGTLHVVLNNQIGFTTEPEEGRSTTYATDVARMLQIPIFHVNGEDLEAVAQVVSLAMDFRRDFQRDVVIDLCCYRRLGHNEGDEPRFTQPGMYGAIDGRRPVRQVYVERLLELGEVTEAECEGLVEQSRANLEEEFEAIKSEEFDAGYGDHEKIWSGYLGGPEPDDDDPETGVAPKRLAQIVDLLGHAPRGFTPHPKLARWLQHRQEMSRGERPLDFAAAEALAFGTLSLDQHAVRLSGQDAARGTFSHRHAVLHDAETSERYTPLAYLDAEQAPVEFLNSPLSEAGVLGFEYGFSLDYPDALVAWEAQFGDFCNAAQVIVDQFITSTEEKWNRLSGLVLLLPHGYEGQGPEHSSARPERLLQLSTDSNVQVVYPSTPAQYFHVLRRQALRRWHKPLFVLTPKSMLRNPRVVSPLEDCGAGRFEKVIADTRSEGQRTRRVLACSGKIYWDLLARREELEAEDVAILRVEQLAPYPGAELERALQPFDAGTPVVWVQEEPRNMGFWHYLKLKSARRALGDFPLTRITRPVSASPSTGSLAQHRQEQEALMSAAFAED